MYLKKLATPKKWGYNKVDILKFVDNVIGFCAAIVKIWNHITFVYGPEILF